MRFVHLSDTHVGPTVDYTLRGRLTLPILETLIHEINALPFRPDFVLHTGDVVDDASEAAYALVKPIFERLQVPIYYAIGNHDRPGPLQQVLLGKTEIQERYDTYTEIDGTGLIVLDTLGPEGKIHGTLKDKQLAWLRDLCRPDGPPLIIGMHHQPVKLDVTWLDDPWPDGHWMPLDCGPAFLEAIAPARDRIRGVFFGHVHRAFEVYQDGILFCGAPSGLSQLAGYPGQNVPLAAPDELPGFNLVTVTGTQTVVRQHTFRP